MRHGKSGIESLEFGEEVEIGASPVNLSRGAAQQFAREDPPPKSVVERDEMRRAAAFSCSIELQTCI